MVGEKLVAVVFHPCQGEDLSELVESEVIKLGKEKFGENATLIETRDEVHYTEE